MRVDDPRSSSDLVALQAKMQEQAASSIASNYLPSIARDLPTLIFNWKSKRKVLPHRCKL
uniref:Uncharacterized protein n=1 Tax=Nelumbo nucifera TaxID=4432 RepID=A0A822Z2A9_NELNU|nr:TPA_asm: hypothetical protein HUJ06_007768 [Nelumbo nucifera]